MTVNLGSVPDITNKQVLVITQSPSLGREDWTVCDRSRRIGYWKSPGVNELSSVSRFEIVVTNRNGTPVTIADIAEEVGYGNQVRYDAFTQDGEEAVGGIIMMLKSLILMQW